MIRWMSCSLLLIVLATPTLAATFTVDSDLGDAPTDLATPGSLGWAVYQANTTAGADTIGFAVPSDGSPVVIQPVAEYVLTDPGTTIDGFTQPGAQPNTIDAPGGLDAVLMISLDGSQIAGGGRAVVRIETDQVTLRGLNIHSGPLAEVAICLDTSDCSSNAVEGCYLGTDPTGTQARPSGWLPWNPPYAIGVWLANGASGNVVGDGADGNFPEHRNLMAGEHRGDEALTGYGVLLDGTGSDPEANLIDCNRIGTDPAGAALPNSTGIGFLNGSIGNDVRFNAIAGNTAVGIHMLVVDDGGPNRSNHILSNHVGLTPDGTAATPNGGAGILLGPGSESNRIGDGDLYYGANVISGNTGPGIHLLDPDGADARTNDVIYNLIGLAADGSQAVGNGGDGILLEQVIGERITGNVVSGNAGHGLHMKAGRFSTIDYNRIGLAAFDDTAVPNAGDGCRSESAGDLGSADNSLENNLISNNLGDGYAVEGIPVSYNYDELWTNTVEGNHGTGIRLRGARAGAGVFHNQIRSNGSDGILAEGGHYSLLNNTIELNQGYGVRLLPDFGADASIDTAGDDWTEAGEIRDNTIQANALGGIRAVDTAPLYAHELHLDNTVGDNDGLPRVEVLWYAAVELLDEEMHLIASGDYAIELQGADGSSITFTIPAPLQDGTAWGPAGMEASDVRTWALLRDFVVDGNGVYWDANPYTIRVSGPTHGETLWTFDGDGDNDPGQDVFTPNGRWTVSWFRYQVAQVVTTADGDGDGIDDADDCAPTDPAYQGPGGVTCDADGDGYCDATIAGNVRQADCPNDCPLPICPPTDCDDTDPFENPGADEIFCNFEDDDCDPATGDDPDPADADADGYTAGCGQDCDDTDPQTNPGGEEICGDGVDQDCNGVDLDCGCVDADGDGYTDAACGGNDCDDTDPAVHPNVEELCNGTDDDCDGRTDEDFGQYTCGVGLCERTVDVCVDGVYQSCVPSEPPEAVETTCDDGVDNDCDDYTDAQDLDCAGCQTPDVDGDGYDAAVCGGADCDDADPAVNPGADEDCDNWIDDDCDGLVDVTDPSCGGKAGGCGCAVRPPLSPASALLGLLGLLLLGLAALRRK